MGLTDDVCGLREGFKDMTRIGTCYLVYKASLLHVFRLDYSTEGIVMDKTASLIAGEPDKEMNPKKLVWELIQPDLRTDARCVATYRGAAFEVAGKGVCTAQTMSESEIK